MTILNETTIESTTLAPVIRRQVYRHAGLKASRPLVVRVRRGRRALKVVGALHGQKRIVLVMPEVTCEADWRRHAPQLAQVVAVLAAKWSGRHGQLARKPKFTAPAATIDEFALAADIPFRLRPNARTLHIEQRLAVVKIALRDAKERYTVARRKYLRYQNWEKQLRFRLRKLGSQLGGVN